jgi:N-acyl-D-aspartate/D-glutamate deacylase
MKLTGKGLKGSDVVNFKENETFTTKDIKAMKKKLEKHAIQFIFLGLTDKACKKILGIGFPEMLECSGTLKLKPKAVKQAKTAEERIDKAMDAYQKSWNKKPDLKKLKNITLKGCKIIK